MAALALGCGAHTGGAEEPHATESAEAPIPAEGHVVLREPSRAFIEVETIAASREVLELRLPARVVFREEALARIGAPVAGRVMEVHVSVGDHVVPGQALITLRSPEAAASRASLASGTASLSAARRAVERVHRMMGDGVGTERELVEAEARVAELEADVARARATVGLLGSGGGATLVLRSPLEGIVLSRSATPGGAVAEGEGPLVEVGDPGRSWIEADLYERDLDLVHDGEAVRVSLLSHAEPAFGDVVRVGAVVDPVTRAAPIRIELDELLPTLRPGMVAWAYVAVDDAGITVPTRSVLVVDGRSYAVFVEEESGEFVRRPVEIGSSIGERIQIRSGLMPGDRVVVRGALLLDGAADFLL